MQGISPGSRLLAAALRGLCFAAAITMLALSQPWLGLDLRWDAASGSARVIRAVGPAQAIAPGTMLTTVAQREQQHRLSDLDFTIEPDGNLATYTQYRLFLQRQGELAAILAAPRLTLTDTRGQAHEILPGASRPLAELPKEFWIQLFVGFFAFLMVTAVWVFRPRDVAARYLLLNGLCLCASASGAAVYTTRELAIPTGELLLLKTLNFGGGLMFFATLLALLWHYPRRLGPAWVAVGIVLAFLAWYFMQALGMLESILVGRRWPTFVAMLATAALALVQWRNTRRDPIGRAALQWFLMSWLVGTSLFMVIVFVPQFYGVDTSRLQAYSFLLTLLIYGGLAFGVTRFRLFELGEWWFRTLTWVLGALMLVALDLLLLVGMHLSFTLSLTLALVVSGFLWLPLRGWLWLRLMQRGRLREADLFKSVLHVALAPTAEARVLRWRSLLQASFAPLRIEPLSAPLPKLATIANQGLALHLPAITTLPALRLEYADEGRRLFSPRDLARVAQLVEMIEHASASRDAYNQGVRDERERIARDLHDDLGSQLLTALHQPRIEPARASIGKAIATMRGILDQLTGKDISLSMVIAELRHETRLRLDGSSIELHWPVDEDPAQDPQLEHHLYRHYLSVVRELLANIIRHAGASTITVKIHLDDQHIVTEIDDDGQGFDGSGKGGYGLDNLGLRLSELGGRLEYRPSAQGTITWVSIPLQVGASAQRAAAAAVLRASGDIG